MEKIRENEHGAADMYADGGVVLVAAGAPNRLFCAVSSASDRLNARHAHFSLVAVPAGQCGPAGWAWRGSSGMARQLSTPMAMTVSRLRVMACAGPPASAPK